MGDPRAVPVVMRYAQGGGLTAERRTFREGIRREAAERFARGEETSVIAKDLRVSDRSVERWGRAWREGGTAALASAGPGEAAERRAASTSRRREGPRVGAV